MWSGWGTSVDSPTPDTKSTRVTAGPTVIGALRRSWHVPALVGAGLALALGIGRAFQTAVQPDFSSPLRDAETLIGRGEYEPAIGVLNSRVFPFLEKPVLTKAQRGLYHLLMARALYKGQRTLPVPHPDNDRNAVAQFLAAEELGLDLGAEDQAALARSYLALGDRENAAARAERVPATSRDLRDALLKELVGWDLAQRPPAYSEALDLVTEAIAEPALGPSMRVWALGVQARVRTELGFTDEALTQLLRELPLLVGTPDLDLSGLHLALGRAYFDLGALDEAERALRLVDRDEVADEGTDERAEAMLMLGRIDARRGGESGMERARERFQALVERYSGSWVYPEALLGLAEAEAELGEPEAAVESYVLLSGLVTGSQPPVHPTKAEVTQSLLSEFERSAGAERWPEALRFATVAQDMWSLREAPPEALLASARAHEASALLLLGDAAAEPFKAFVKGDLDPATQVEIKRHLLRAAGFYNAYAERFIVDDLATHMDALWKAANLFDRAGDKGEAVRTFSEFTEVSRGDARRPEARFRLAEAQRARGEYATAAAMYGELIEERRAGGVVEVGPWADASLVPLAQCYLADADDANDAEAEQVLLRAIDGAAGGPARPAYREALTELGRLYYKQERYNEALERLDEAMVRTPADEIDAGARFRIADTRRKLASAIQARLDQATREGERALLRTERVKHLEGALAGFAEVRDALAQVDPRRLSQLDAVYLRNAMFYLGDCAFDLGDMETAIAHYTAARRRYAEDPASLVALMQIVSAYIALGDLPSAKAANQRARDFYRSLPAEVWEDESLPISRADWQAWLDSTTALYDRLAGG